MNEVFLKISTIMCREYLKDKTNELETISNNKNIRHLWRGTNEFKNYKPKTNFEVSMGYQPYKYGLILQ
jgi:hypothetical protein